MLSSLYAYLFTSVLVTRCVFSIIGFEKYDPFASLFDYEQEDKDENKSKDTGKKKYKDLDKEEKEKL